MAEEKTRLPKPAAPKAAGAAKPGRAKPAAAKPVSAKPAGRAKPTGAKPTAPARRAVARPVTRALTPRVQRRRAAGEAQVARPARERRPLPTAPAGHAPVIAADGSSAGSLELPASLVSASTGVGVLVQALLAERANKRGANAATKNRTRVKGGGGKPWRQKGTGRARQGSTRSPQWRHGAVVFGPNGRRYKQRIPARMRRAAFSEAFAARAAEGRVIVFDQPPLGDKRPRTAALVAWLAGIGDTGSALLVTVDGDTTTARAVANAGRVEIRTAGTLRLTDVLTHDTVLVARPALEALAARAGDGSDEVAP